MAKKPTDQVQLKLRFDERLRRKLEQEAIRNDRSLNSEIVYRLEHYTERLGLLGEVLQLAYGSERWTRFFLYAHKNGKLRLSDQTKDAMKAAMNQALNDFVDKVPGKTS
jgi:hypothetical protein